MDSVHRAPGPVFTVTTLAEHVRDLLDTAFPLVTVDGELSRVTYHRSGHVYFTLKDEGARLDAALFRRQAQACAFPLTEGLLVRVRARVTVYPPQGRLQLVIEEMEQQGTGALLARFEALKARLAAEGLFASERKRPLPFLPRVVGVVTSPGAAALRDILRVLHERFPVRVLLAPAAVQGAGAAVELRAALARIGAEPDVDVVILGRGGGSVEDLWAFNDEALVRAVAASPVPVVSAVGHEVDVVLTDFAADWRAPTPSAAAERVVPRRDDLTARLGEQRARLAAATGRQFAFLTQRLGAVRGRLGDPRRLLRDRRLRLADLERRLPAALELRHARERERLAELTGRLAAAKPATRLALQRARLEAVATRLHGGLRQVVAGLRVRLDAAGRTLHVLGPAENLRRGYAIVRRADRPDAISDAAAFAAGDGAEVLLARGRLDCRVERVTLPPDAPPAGPAGEPARENPLVISPP